MSVSRCAVALLAGVSWGLPAWALNPPPVDQRLTEWSYVLDMNTADPSDDWVSADYFWPEGALHVDVADCTSLDLPPNQPKVPEGCGSLLLNGQVFGYWLYYDGDAADAPVGGWNSGNRWWRNRLIFRTTDTNLVMAGLYVTNPEDPACLTTAPCTGGIKFCGTATASVQGVAYSGGGFETCSQPE